MTLPTIVVGVDGSPASHAALRVAIDEASYRRGRVLVVGCWSHGGSVTTAQAIVHDAVDAVAADHHERSLIAVECGEGDAGTMLVDAGRNAELLVIGSTSRGATARRLGRATVDHCLDHGTVPLLVVPFVPYPLEEASRAPAQPS